MSRANNECSAQHAFTLIELMVVIVLMAILSGALVPSIVSAARRTGAKAAATKVVDLLDFAYATAIARRQPVVVNLDSERRLCWVSVQSISLPWLSDINEVQPRTLASVALPDGIEVSFFRVSEVAPVKGSEMRWETIRFEPDGTAEDVLIELTDRNQGCWTLEVVAATGEVRMKEER